MDYGIFEKIKFEESMTREFLFKYKDYLILYLKNWKPEVDYSLSDVYRDLKLSEIENYNFDYTLNKLSISPYNVFVKLVGYMKDFDIEIPTFRDESKWVSEYRKLKINSLLDE